MLGKLKDLGRILCNNQANAAYWHILHARSVVLYRYRDKFYKKKKSR